MNFPLYLAVWLQERLVAAGGIPIILSALESQTFGIAPAPPSLMTTAQAGAAAPSASFVPQKTPSDLMLSCLLSLASHASARQAIR